MAIMFFLIKGLQIKEPRLENKSINKVTPINDLYTDQILIYWIIPSCYDNVTFDNMVCMSL